MSATSTPVLVDALSELTGRRIAEAPPSSSLGALGIDDLQLAEALQRAAGGAALPFARVDTVDQLLRAVTATNVSPAPAPSGPLPLSYAQEFAWFLHRIHPGGPAASVARGTWVEEADAQALQAAFSRELEAHQATRLVFSADPVPTQRLTNAALDWAVNEGEGASREAEQQHAQARLDAEATVPFNPTERTLRVRLLRYPSGRAFLIVVAHRLVLDPWSVALLIDRVLAKASPRPSAPDFLDYGQWQRTHLQDADVQRVRESLAAILGDGPRALDLPTDLPRPTQVSLRAGHRPLTLSAQTIEALTALARAEGVPVESVLLAAWVTVISRTCAESELVLGVWRPGRVALGTSRLLGGFSTQELMRGKAPTGSTFREVVRATALAHAESRALPEVPNARWLEALRAASGDTRFQLQVAFGLESSSRRLEHGHTGDILEQLSLQLRQDPSGIRGELAYAADLFSAEAAERIAGHFQVLLDAAVRAPETRIEKLPLLTAAERQQVLVEWNATRVEAPVVCVHTAFEEQAERTPDALAVKFGAKTRSYRELDQAANQLAHALRERGVGPEKTVLVCIRPDQDVPLAFYGVLKAGGAYVPVDPEIPVERLRFIVAASRPTVALVQGATSGPLEGLGIPLLRLDDEPAWRSQPVTRVDSGVQPGNLAYVIFTSGSTGEPKGVEVEHRSVINHNRALQRRLALGAGDRMLQFTPLHFDAAGEEIYPPLLGGAAIVVLGDLLGPAEFHAFVEQEQVSVLSLPPAFMVEWVADLQRRKGQVPRCLRLVILGGEKLLPETLAGWRSVGGEAVPWMNVYGPTEATVTSAICEIGGGGAGLDRTVLPIGRPIDNAALYLLDEHREPVPLGRVGEIYIGGAGLARGYLARPDLTAERFVPDPFSSAPGARLYRTGDLGRFLPDGRIEFVGRADHQVKLRGFRIELGEVESALRKHPHITQAVAQVRTDGGAPKLVAYLVRQPDSKVTPSELRGFLEQSLPAYMVPSAFAFLAQLPLTSALKIDLKALPPPSEEAFGKEDPYQAPRTPVEETLAEIFAAVLNRPRVGINDNFFDLGGESLSAMNVASQASERFGLEVFMGDIFERPTIAQLAEGVAKLQAEQSGAASAQVDAMSDDDVEAMLAELARKATTGAR